MRQNYLLGLVGITLLLWMTVLLRRSTTDGIPGNSNILRPSEEMIEIYKNQAEVRRIELNAVWVNEDESLLTFYNVIVPEVFCAELVRIGSVGDGGKWMCSPHQLSSGCTILSLGLNNDIDFEVDLQTISQERCALIAYDSAEQNPDTKAQLASINGQSFMGVISTVSGPNNTISLNDLRQKHEIQTIEILKIDIEGAEFEALLPFLRKNTVAQILIEIHGGKGYRFLDLLVPLSRLGYWITSYEINGGYPTYSEFSLLHESAFTRYKATPLARYLDLP